MTGAQKRRIAVVLFNLGGPDRPEAVRPFLFNLFNDPAIIGAPAFIRYPLALLIAGARTRTARSNYARMGGSSPLLGETQSQAAALKAALESEAPDTNVEVFIAMRHWAPITGQAARAVAAFAPDEVVLLPLYPQFSTTTTASSLEAWRAAYRGCGTVTAVCCYPTLAGLAEAHARRIEAAWAAGGGPKSVRLIFSAHGLPESVVARGDPYASQVAATAQAVADRLQPAFDWRVAYQSRVGPMKWLGPTTVEAIEEAAGEGLGVIVSPISFVSEHIETLVELDHDYRLLAEKAGCPAYIRAPALGVDAGFIDGLAKVVLAALAHRGRLGPGSGFTCAASWSKCPYRGET